MRVGYTAFLSLKVIYLSSEYYVPIQERDKNLRSNPRSNLGLTGPSKRGLFCVRQQAGIYRINMWREFYWSWLQKASNMCSGAMYAGSIAIS